MIHVVIRTAKGKHCIHKIKAHLRDMLNYSALTQVCMCLQCKAGEAELPGLLTANQNLGMAKSGQTQSFQDARVQSQ